MDALGTCDACGADWALPGVPCPCGCGDKKQQPRFSRLIMTVSPKGKLTWECPECRLVYS